MTSTEDPNHQVMVQHAKAAREGSLRLNALSYAQRQKVLTAVADALDANRQRIIEANGLDMAAADLTDLAAPLKKRLQLTNSKIDTLVEGVRSMVAIEDPIGHVLSARQLDSKLVLVKQTASIGVLLIVFESRPDCLPQIASLALCSGNGLLLKGGREAEHSNAVLHEVIVNAVYEASEGQVPRGVIGLITSRSDVYELLKLDAYIDLVIPRGSNAMVQNIKRSTNIPVLGHADGICHVYAHKDANVAETIEVATDAKLSYPAACNAAETLLLHRHLLESPHESAPSAAHHIVASLTAAGVKFFGGPEAVKASLVSEPASSFHVEYGDEHMTVEIVDSVDAAIDHINTHGSHHTECIMTTDPKTAARFETGVDSACVFHNCSTRFADGYRFGLGAEVGISTSRIHARGPVGVEGLLTQKWLLRPVDEVNGYATVGQFQRGERQYTHKDVTAEYTKSSAQ